MHSSIWGASYWYILHSITFAFDKENELNKNDFKHIIVKIGSVLPCSVCRTHFREQINNKSIPITDYNSITKWLFQRHHYVNTFLSKNNKPIYKSAENMYFNQFNIKKVKKFFHYFLISLKRERVIPYKKIMELFATTWPQKNKRELIKTLVTSDEFQKASSVPLLRKWINKTFVKHILNNIPYNLPTEPTESTEPTEPTESTEPTEPTEPTESRPVTARSVRFATPEPTEQEIKQMRQKLIQLQKRKKNIKTRLPRIRNVQDKINLGRRFNNINLKIRNLKAKLSAL